MNDLCDVEPNSRKNGHELSAETVEKIEKFYLRDDISRPSPNTKDFVTVAENGEKQKLSLKHLLFTVKECYGMFCSENPTVTVGLTKFFLLRPINVVSSTKIPQNVCVCQPHENMRLALKSLKSYDLALAQLHVDWNIHKNFVCDNTTAECFKNSCNECSNNQKFKLKLEEIEKDFRQISWFKWVKVVGDDTPYCNIEKVKKSGSIDDLISDICGQSAEFLQHEFIKTHQAEACKSMTAEALQIDSDSAVVFCDFAEKFKCVQQNAPQSAHYGQTPVSVFTVALYHREMKSFVIASDFEKSSKECVLAYINTIIKQLPPTVKSVDFWSDNATSQFKNQFIMEGLRSFQQVQTSVKINWNFFAPMHGKSVVDGIGGSVKRFVRQKIMTQDLVVKNSSDFVQVASQMKVEMILMNTEDIEKVNSEIKFKEIVDNSKQIKDIKKFHRFEVKHVKKGRKLVAKVVGCEISLNL